MLIAGGASGVLSLLSRYCYCCDCCAVAVAGVAAAIYYWTSSLPSCFFGSLTYDGCWLLAS